MLDSEAGRKVKVEPILPDDVVKQDNWIFDANCIHLAAKFMPFGLKLLLENLMDCQALINVGNHNNCTPLHLAAKNINSLSTR